MKGPPIDVKFLPSLDIQIPIVLLPKPANILTLLLKEVKPLFVL